MKNFFKNIERFFINFLNADKNVQLRTVAFFTSLIAMVAKTVFKKEFVLDPETITALIIEFGVLILGVRSWWKDNPITPEAKEANEYMHALKQEMSNDDYENEDEEDEIEISVG